MRILVAPDKWKGCLPAPAVADAIAIGLARGLPGVEVLRLPVADGGEGTLEALLRREGERREATVTGPLGEPVRAAWGWVGGGLAVIESAQACGLAGIPPERRDLARASSRGLGELIAAALASGARELIVGLGGTATNDGGAGALVALGARLLDREGRPLAPGGAALLELDRIEPGPARERVRVRVACDVDAPLLGPTGATRAFGPQKLAPGAPSGTLALLEAGLARFAEVAARDLGGASDQVATRPGAGAGGGLGAGLAWGLGAELVPGAELVLDALGLDAALAGVDLVIVSEGALDATTAAGKAPAAVARRAAARGIPVVALAGAVGQSAAALLAPSGPLVAALPVLEAPTTLAAAIAGAEGAIVRGAERLGRLLALGARLGPAVAPEPDLEPGSEP